ncbi:unnamed protein product [Paramecium pentaurelia]|uniref:Uncharacterized protein n=1 Tax=Paramecium pentaurelia TaxID=43138 RepID=A0A8S1XUX4_9CILI|nr:unnamed protein product [Paramecium pentaurelia]
MFKNFMYVEYGQELQCHEKLYQNALKKQQKQKEIDYQKQLQILIDKVNEIEDEPPQQITKDFYDYSMKWKNLVNQKRFQEQYQNEMSLQQKSQQHQIQKLPQNYLSPIDGWKYHAQQYFDKKGSRQQNESSFQPSINEKSKLMEFDEPVEDRLIKYGQQREQKYLFEKQFEKFYEQVQNDQRPTKPNEEVFSRLYNYERKQPQPEVYQLNINKLPPEFEERVKKRREQYSLFENRQTRAQTEITDHEIKVLSQNQFDEFLKRNFCNNFRTQSFKEESIESYPFQPELNKKSLELASKNTDTLIERQEKFLIKKQQTLQQYQEEQQLEKQRQFENEFKQINKPSSKIRVNKPSKSPIRQQNAYNLQTLINKQVPQLF